jgi:hypothetical protein
MVSGKEILDIKMNLEEEKVRNVMKRRKMKYIFSQKVNA